MKCHYKNVGVKPGVKAQRTKEAHCITKTSNNKELVRKKSHGTSKKKYIDKERELQF